MQVERGRFRVARRGSSGRQKVILTTGSLFATLLPF